MQILSVETILEKFRTCESELIKQVLTQLLKREPTLSDAKDLTRYYPEDVVDRYMIAYKGLKLGVVKISFIDYCVTFEPLDNKEFLEPAENADGTKVTFDL